MSSPQPDTMPRGRITLALALLSLALGATTAFFATRYAGERERAAALDARLAALQAERTAAGAPANAAAPDPGPAVDAASTTPAADEREPAAAVEARLRAVREQARAERRETVRRLREDPAYRAAMLAQYERAIRRRSEGLDAALGLTSAEARGFYVVLAEERLREFEENLLFAADHLGAGGGADPEPFAERAEALRRETAERLRARLGEGRYERWREFERNAPAREIARDVRDSMAGSREPLRPEQERKVAAAIAVELDADRAWARAQQERLSQLGQLPADEMGRIAEEMLARREAAGRRLRAALTPALSPQQLARFDQMLAQQLMLERAQFERQGAALGMDEQSFAWSDALDTMEY